MKLIKVKWVEKITANEQGLAFVGELEFRLPITKAQ
jgi:hypothetical protein